MIGETPSVRGAGNPASCLSTDQRSSRPLLGKILPQTRAVGMDPTPALTGLYWSYLFLIPLSEE